MPEGLIPAAISILSLSGAVLCLVHAFKARTRTRTALSILGSVPLFIVALFFSLNVFLLPYDLEALWFESQLHLGMTRAQVDDMRSRTHGALGYAVNSNVGESCTGDAECISYPTSAYVCLGGGDVFWVGFDAQQRVGAWKHGTWGDGC